MMEISEINGYLKGLQCKIVCPLTGLLPKYSPKHYLEFSVVKIVERLRGREAEKWRSGEVSVLFGVFRCSRWLLIRIALC